MRDKKILTLLLFLLCLCSQEYSLATAIPGDVSKTIKQNAEKNNEQMDNEEAEARAVLFVNSNRSYWKDQKNKQRSLRSMKLMQHNADNYRKNKDFGRAIERYYVAAMNYPRTLLLFKHADLGLQEILNHYEKIHPELLRISLKNYRLSLAFYKYEPENDKSVSNVCLEKMQREVDCLWEAYCDAYKNTANTALPEDSSQYLTELQEGYRHDHFDAVVPKEDILKCMRLGPDVFRYEDYCK